MVRRMFARLATLALLLLALLLGAVTARASHAGALDPAALALPASALPAGSTVTHSAVSPNSEADDASANAIKNFHPAKTYASMGRITGYREQITIPAGGGSVSAEYLASVFASAAAAQAALQDAKGLVSLIGSPLPPFSAGDVCFAYAGPYNGQEILYGALARGPVAVEIAFSVDPAVYNSASSAIQSDLVALLAAADTQIQAGLAQSGGTSTAGPPTASPTPAPPTATAVPVPARALGAYYVALGDSFSAGYLTGSPPYNGQYDAQCTAPDAPGFTCVFWRYLREVKPGIAFHNFSEPGADSCELAGAGRRCYDPTPRANPLDATVAFLQSHPGQVSPVTLTIGGNDLLALLTNFLKDPSGTAARLPGIFDTYRANLDVILGRLRAADRTGTIIVTTQPNPLGGLGSPPLPSDLSGLADRALGQLNGIMKSEAARYGAVVAESAAAFDAYPGKGGALTFVTQYLPQGKFEIHPTPTGYRVYGEAVIAASGYRLPLSAALAQKRVKRTGRERVAGRTTPGLLVRVVAHLPGGVTRRASTHPRSNSRFALAFKVGSRAGTGRVQVCAIDADKHSTCRNNLRFTVR